MTRSPSEYEDSIYDFDEWGDETTWECANFLGRMESDWPDEDCSQMVEEDDMEIDIEIEEEKEYAHSFWAAVDPEWVWRDCHCGRYRPSSQAWCECGSGMYWGRRADEPHPPDFILSSPECQPCSRDASFPCGGSRGNPEDISGLLSGK